MPATLTPNDTLVAMRFAWQRSPITPPTPGSAHETEPLTTTFTVTPFTVTPAPPTLLTVPAARAPALPGDVTLTEVKLRC